MDFYYIYYLFLGKIFLMLFVLGFSKERTNNEIFMCTCMCMRACAYVFVY